MSKEIEEQLTTIENVSQEKLVETIKASKREFDSLEQGLIASKPSIIQDYTSEIFEKIDSKIPSYVQLYSDLYKKYLQNVSNFYIPSFLVQKEFLDKMGVGDAILAMFDDYLGSVKQMVLRQIDFNENVTKSYVSVRLSVLDLYDTMTSRNIFNFVKMFSFSA